MTTIGKLWTAGIAYVALAVGAGLSIMYNILDTMQVRGAAFDWADLVTAIAAPGMVVLMVEVFVSRWWIGTPWYVQALRWAGVLGIGGVAMRASWTHGHDWMASRGQTEDVAMAWPLAIDLLAIMATALILTGRIRGHVAMATFTPLAKDADGQLVATGQSREVAIEDLAAVATDGHKLANQAFVAMADEVRDGHDPMANRGHFRHEPGDVATGYVPPSDQEMATAAAAGPIEDTLATQPLSEAYAATLKAELEAWQLSADEAVTDAGQELAGEAEAFITPRTFSATVPAEAIKMIQAWDGIGEPKDFDAQVAAHFGKSARTARRWRSIVTGKPTSGA